MNLRDQLMLMEGLRLKPYRDTEGHLTIGYGCNLDDGITQEEAEYLLTNRLRKATQDVDRAFPWARFLSAPRFAVLVNMAYQMGLGGLKQFRKMLAALEQSDFDTAAREMLDSRWAKVQTPGRAHQLAKQMQEDLWP